jgi:hypothetical protein
MFVYYCHVDLIISGVIYQVTGTVNICMRVDNNPLAYVPLIDPPVVNKNQPALSDQSLLVMTPEEIQRNLEQWRQQQATLHVVA